MKQDRAQYNIQRGDAEVTESVSAKKDPLDFLNLPPNATQEQLEIAYNQKLRKIASHSEANISIEELNWAYKELCKTKSHESRRNDGVVSAELFPELAFSLDKPDGDVPPDLSNIIEMNKRTGATAVAQKEDAAGQRGPAGNCANTIPDRRSELEVLLEMPEITETCFNMADDGEDVLEQIVVSDSFSEVFQPKKIKAIIGEGEKEVVGIRTPNSYRNDARSTVEQLIQSSKIADGKLLVQLRTAMGVSVEEISSRTKISMRHIQAMEGDNFSNLPALVYFRGFIESYLKYLGIEHQGLVNAYIENYLKAKKFSFRQLFRG